MEFLSCAGLCLAARPAVATARTRGIILLTTMVLLGTIPHLVQCQTQSSDTDDSSTTGTSLVTGGECMFDVSVDGISSLNESFGEGNVFVYLHLQFPQFFAEGLSGIIDPSTWVVVTKGKGNLLLSLPFDYTQLSMGALLPGVKHVNLPLKFADPSCLQYRNDSDVLQEMAETLFETMSMAVDVGEADSELIYSICIERQLQEDELDKTISVLLPGSSYILFQTSTVYDCWAEDGGSLPTSPVTISKYRSLIYSVYILGIILALYSPLAGFFFIRISPFPPQTERAQSSHSPSQPPGPATPITQTFKTVAVHADLSHGFKYNLVFAGEDNRWIRLFRWLVIVIVFGVVPYTPYIAWSAKGQFKIRMTALDDAGILSYATMFGLHILIELCYYVTITSILTFSFDDFDHVTRVLQVKKVDRIYFGLVELPDELQVPENIETDNQEKHRRAYGFFEAMYFRAFGLFNVGIYTYFLGSPFVWLQSKIQGPNVGPGIATFVACILYLFAFPVILLYFIINMLFYAFPLGDLLLFFLRKLIRNKVNVRDILVAIGTALLAVAVFFKFIAVFVYIGELIGFTFVGFLLNTESVGEYILAGVVFIGYILNAITGYYDGYCKLLLRIVELADERDERLETEKRLQWTIEQTQNGNTGQTGIPTSTEFNRILFYNDQGVPFIKKDLWERVVLKYRPVRIGIFNVCLQLCTLVVVIGLGLSIIKTVDGYDDIPASVEFFGTVIVTGVVPVLLLVFRSPGKMDCLDESVRRQLEADLEYYADHGEFISDILQY